MQAPPLINRQQCAGTTGGQPRPPKTAECQEQDKPECSLELPEPGLQLDKGNNMGVPSFSMGAVVPADFPNS